MSAPKNKKAKISSDEEDYFEATSGGRPRPSYASSFPDVAKEQAMKRSNSGNHYTFESAINPGVFHTLDSLQRESIPQKPKGGKPRPNLLQHPAMDHYPVQFAALQEVHDSTVTQERQKAQQGLKRRHSVDLHDAFSAATKDQKNLRLVTHPEHVSQGASTKRGNFSAAKSKQAKTFYESHLPSIPSTPTRQKQFDQSRPKSHTPFPGGQSVAISGRVTRSQTNKK